jgi:hypothetical protein
MKTMITRISRSRRQMRRKGVVEILRASYERFANDSDSLIALNAVLRSGDGEYWKRGSAGIILVPKPQV